MEELTSALLDQCYSSLSFFSAEDMRFNIFAFMICGLEGLLKTSEPVFQLWHGLDVKKAGKKGAGSLGFRLSLSHRRINLSK